MNILNLTNNTSNSSCILSPTNEDISIEINIMVNKQITNQFYYLTKINHLNKIQKLLNHIQDHQPDGIIQIKHFNCLLSSGHVIKIHIEIQNFEKSTNWFDNYNDKDDWLINPLNRLLYYWENLIKGLNFLYKEQILLNSLCNSDFYLVNDNSSSKNSKTVKISIKSVIYAIIEESPKDDHEKKFVKDIIIGNKAYTTYQKNFDYILTILTHTLKAKKLNATEDQLININKAINQFNLIINQTSNPQSNVLKALNTDRFIEIVTMNMPKLNKLFERIDASITTVTTTIDSSSASKQLINSPESSSRVALKTNKGKSLRLKLTNQTKNNEYNHKKTYNVSSDCIGYIQNQYRYIKSDLQTKYPRLFKHDFELRFIGQSKVIYSRKKLKFNLEYVLQNPKNFHEVFKINDHFHLFLANLLDLLGQFISVSQLQEKITLDLIEFDDFEIILLLDSYIDTICKYDPMNGSQSTPRVNLNIPRQLLLDIGHKVLRYPQDILENLHLMDILLLIRSISNRLYFHDIEDLSIVKFITNNINLKYQANVVNIYGLKNLAYGDNINIVEPYENRKIKIVKLRCEYQHVTKLLQILHTKFARICDYFIHLIDDLIQVDFFMIDTDFLFKSIIMNIITPKSELLSILIYNVLLVDAWYPDIDELIKDHIDIHYGYIISHDVQTPICKIKYFQELYYLKQKLEIFEKKDQKFKITEMLREHKTAKTFFEDLLVYNPLMEINSEEKYFKRLDYLKQFANELKSQEFKTRQLYENFVYGKNRFKKITQVQQHNMNPKKTDLYIALDQISDRQTEFLTLDSNLTLSNKLSYTFSPCFSTKVFSPTNIEGLLQSENFSLKLLEQRDSKQINRQYSNESEHSENLNEIKLLDEKKSRNDNKIEPIKIIDFENENLNVSNAKSDDNTKKNKPISPKKKPPIPSLSPSSAISIEVKQSIEKQAIESSKNGDADIGNVRKVELSEITSNKMPKNEEKRVILPIKVEETNQLLKQHQKTTQETITNLKEKPNVPGEGKNELDPKNWFEFDVDRFKKIEINKAEEPNSRIELDKLNKIITPFDIYKTEPFDPDQNNIGKELEHDMNEPEQENLLNLQEDLHQPLKLPIEPIINEQIKPVNREIEPENTKINPLNNQILSPSSQIEPANEQLIVFESKILNNKHQGQVQGQVQDQGQVQGQNQGQVNPIKPNNDDYTPKNPEEKIRCLNTSPSNNQKGSTIQNEEEYRIVVELVAKNEDLEDSIFENLKEYNRQNKSSIIDDEKTKEFASFQNYNSNSIYDNTRKNTLNNDNDHDHENNINLNHNPVLIKSPSAACSSSFSSKNSEENFNFPPYTIGDDDESKPKNDNNNKMPISRNYDEMEETSSLSSHKSRPTIEKTITKSYENSSLNSEKYNEKDEKLFEENEDGKYWNSKSSYSPDELSKRSSQSLHSQDEKIHNIDNELIKSKSNNSIEDDASQNSSQHSSSNDSSSKQKSHHTDKIKADDFIDVPNNNNDDNHHAISENKHKHRDNSPDNQEDHHETDAYTEDWQSTNIFKANNNHPRVFRTQIVSKLEIDEESNDPSNTNANPNTNTNANANVNINANANTTANANINANVNANTNPNPNANTNANTKASPKATNQPQKPDNIDLIQVEADHHLENIKYNEKEHEKLQELPRSIDNLNHELKTRNDPTSNDEGNIPLDNASSKSEISLKIDIDEKPKILRQEIYLKSDELAEIPIQEPKPITHDNQGSLDNKDLIPTIDRKVNLNTIKPNINENDNKAFQTNDLITSPKNLENEFNLTFDEKIPLNTNLIILENQNKSQDKANSSSDYMNNRPSVQHDQPLSMNITNNQKEKPGITKSIEVALDMEKDYEKKDDKDNDYDDDDGASHEERNESERPITPAMNIKQEKNHENNNPFMDLLDFHSPLDNLDIPFGIIPQENIEPEEIHAQETKQKHIDHFEVSNTPQKAHNFADLLDLDGDFFSAREIIQKNHVVEQVPMTNTLSKNPNIHEEGPFKKSEFFLDWINEQNHENNHHPEDLFKSTRQNLTPIHKKNPSQEHYDLDFIDFAGYSSLQQSKEPEKMAESLLSLKISKTEGFSNIFENLKSKPIIETNPSLEQHEVEQNKKWVDFDVGFNTKETEAKHQVTSSITIEEEKQKAEVKEVYGIEDFSANYNDEDYESSAKSQENQQQHDHYDDNKGSHDEEDVKHQDDWYDMSLKSTRTVQSINIQSPLNNDIKPEFKGESGALINTTKYFLLTDKVFEDKHKMIFEDEEYNIRLYEAIDHEPDNLKELREYPKRLRDHQQEFENYGNEPGDDHKEPRNDNKELEDHHKEPGDHHKEPRNPQKKLQDDQNELGDHQKDPRNLHNKLQDDQKESGDHHQKKFQDDQNEQEDHHNHPLQKMIFLLKCLMVLDTIKTKNYFDSIQIDQFSFITNRIVIKTIPSVNSKHISVHTIIFEKILHEITKQQEGLAYELGDFELLNQMKDKLDQEALHHIINQIIFYDYMIENFHMVDFEPIEESLLKANDNQGKNYIVRFSDPIEVSIANEFNQKLENLKEVFTANFGDSYLEDKVIIINSIQRSKVILISLINSHGEDYNETQKTILLMKLLIQNPKFSLALPTKFSLENLILINNAFKVSILGKSIDFDMIEETFHIISSLLTDNENDNNENDIDLDCISCQDAFHQLGLQYLEERFGDNYQNIIYDMVKYNPSHDIILAALFIFKISNTLILKVYISDENQSGNYDSIKILDNYQYRKLYYYLDLVQENIDPQHYEEFKYSLMSNLDEDNNLTEFTLINHQLNMIKYNIYNGDILYFGDFDEKLQPFGYGRSFNKNEIYIGKFKNGIRHGQGDLYILTNSTHYSGYFVKGKYHGQGTLYDPNGIPIISGNNWINNQYQGEGIGIGVGIDGSVGIRHTTMSNNTKYIGEFKDSKYHGHGKLYYPNMDIIHLEGDFKEGKKHGKFNVYNIKGEFESEYFYQNDLIIIEDSIHIKSNENIINIPNLNHRYNIQILEDDIDLILKSKTFNNKIMNFYMEYLKEIHEKDYYKHDDNSFFDMEIDRKIDKIYYFLNTIPFNLKSNLDSIKLITKPYHGYGFLIFDVFDRILLPINIEKDDHWCLCEINTTQKTNFQFILYDTLSDHLNTSAKDNPVLLLVKEYAIKEVQDKCKENENIQDYIDRINQAEFIIADVNQDQKDNGIFVCGFATEITNQQQEIIFNKKNVDDFTKTLVSILLGKEIDLSFENDFISPIANKKNDPISPIISMFK